MIIHSPIISGSLTFADGSTFTLPDGGNYSGSFSGSLTGNVNGIDILDVKTDVDAILSGSSADKNSFSEIVTLINSIDTDNDAAFASHYTSSRARLSSLENETGSIGSRVDDLELFSSSLSTDYNDLENVPSGIISSSEQLAADFLDTLGDNVVSSSAQIDLTQTTNYADGIKLKLDAENVFSSSAQVTITESQISDLVHYTDSDVKSKLDTEGVISGSSQLTGDLDSRYVNTNGDNAVTSSAQITLANTTGNLSSSRVVGDIQASSVEYSNILNKPTLFSGSAQVTITESQISDLVHYTDSDVKTKLNTEDVISGSSSEVKSFLSITSSDISDVEAFSQSGNYSGLRAQATTAGDVGLGNVTNESKSTMFTSPSFTGNPTAPTQTGTDDSTKLATTAFVQNRVDTIIGTAGSTLDTLGELSASLADDQGALSTLTQTVGTKLAKSSNLSDLTDAGTARTNLGVDVAGTDNSTDVTLVTTSHDYLSLSGQAITLGTIQNDDLANSSITINGSAISLGGSVTTPNDNTQLSNEQVQDIVGGMVSGNTESGITVTYQDTDGTIDFSVASQTDNNFTNTLKTKLDGIAENAQVNTVDSVSGKTGDVTLVKGDVGLGNVENTALSTYTGNGGALDNQYITNGAGYITSFTNTNQLTTFQVEDGDGTEVTISHGKEWKFVEGTGIDINWTDTSNGSDGDPYDLTITNTAPFTGDVFDNDGTFASLRAQGTTAGDVGLGNVTNESKATMFTSPTFTGTVSGVTKTHVGLGNVDNTSDADKPVSTATQTALNGKLDTTHDFSITLTGDVTGTGTVTNMGNVSFSTTVGDDSHNHTIANVDGLQDALNLKANLASPTFTGTVIAPTPPDNDDSTKVATTAFVMREVNDLLGGAPAAFDTLLEISASIANGDSDVVALTTVVGGKLQKDQNLSDLTNATTARTNLGLGSLATLSTVDAATITDNSVGASELNVTGNGTTAQFLRSDGDGTFTWATPTDTNTTYSVGDGGLTQNNFTNALKTKLDGIEENADVTDSTNVSSAGALMKSGGTMTGNINFNTTEEGITWSMNTDGAYIKFYNTSDGDSNSRLEYGTTDNGDEYHRWMVSTNERMNLKDSGLTVTGGITATGDVVAYASSDRRLKDNIVNIENPIEKVQKLNGVTWDWNGNADELQQSLPNVGVIAQEVEEVFPQLVNDRENGYKGVDYAKLTGLLIEAVKEQQKQIDELKSRLG